MNQITRKRKGQMIVWVIIGLLWSGIFSVTKILSSVYSSLILAYDDNSYLDGRRMSITSIPTSEMKVEELTLSVADLVRVKDAGEDKTFDPAEITHVYHLGHKRPYGRSNNQMVTILHAVDMVIDNHGDLPNNNAVVAVSRWAFDVLKGVFYNGRNSTEFAIQLEQLQPVIFVHEDRLEALELTESHNKTQIYVSAKDAYFYIERNRQRFTPQMLKKRRQAVLGSLLKHGVAERNLVLYNVVRDYIGYEIYGESKHGEMKYVTIHSRWLEGECERRVGNLLPKDECWMTPAYIKDIMGGVIDRPIVLIGDGQNQEVVDNLRNDADIGPHLIIPQEIVPDHVEILWWSQPWSDMMVAIMGDTFIGTRASSFATIVGILRVVRGADPASNYIYTSRNNSTVNERSDVEICEDCLFLCDKDRSNLCGHDVIYS